MNIDAILKRLNNKHGLNKHSKVLIVGLGKTGFSVAKFLHKLAIEFAIVDSRHQPHFNDQLLQEYPDIAVFTGGFDSVAFEVVTHLVVSPGVSLQEKQIKNAISLGVKLVSDIDFFACATEKPVLAITGSNGKSTVTTMLGVMGNKAGINTAVGGNIGVPALDLLAESIELYVIELSSFQLERLTGLNAKVATVLNISEDHFDRHIDINNYAKEKQRIFSGNGVMVLNEDDAIVKNMAVKGRKQLTFSIQKKTGFHIEVRQDESWLMNSDQPLMRQAEIPLKGLHNIANALAALALGSAIGLPDEVMCQVLRSFKGLEHRMQTIAKIKGVTWVNDSKATNVAACVAALQGYKDKVILIAGGDAKGADINHLIPVIRDKAKCVVLMGKDAVEIEQALNGCVPSFQAKTIQEAVSIAEKIAEKGESVLLSPACASIDQYKNYQERGQRFTEAVLRLVA